MARTVVPCFPRYEGSMSHSPQTPHPPDYLDSMFSVEVSGAQTGIEVVTQRLQSLNSGQQLALVLQEHKS